MGLVKSFLANNSGSTVEKFAFGAVLVMLASIATTTLLTRIASTNTVSRIAQSQNEPDPRYVALGSLGPTMKKAPEFNNIDATPTASIALSSGRPIVLDPCTGKSK